MFNINLYTTFNLLFMVIVFIQNNQQNKPLFLILVFQQMSSCEFRETIVLKDF
jgi:hypothetical protein